MNYGFVIDNRKCIGCHACSTACKSENEVPLGVNRTWVKYTETGIYPNSARNFQVTRCNHCTNPPCVRICPTSAMYQRDNGIVEFNSDYCIGCKGCMQACPYDAIYIDPSTGTAAKCHFCAHRIDIGLEPSCVVVCPEHAIIAGDIDNPNSEITKILSSSNVTVRKPEQGTAPKLFYIDGHDAAMHPTAAVKQPDSFIFAEAIAPFPQSRETAPLLNQRAEDQMIENKPNKWGLGADPANEPIKRKPGHQGMPASGPINIGGKMADHMVQVVHSAQHKIPWHWPVPAYIVTKDIAAGMFLLVALFFGTGALAFQQDFALLAGLISLVFTGLTTVFLIVDLDKPLRFLYIVLRPQMNSWLAKGAFVLISFSTILGLWVMVEVGNYYQIVPDGLTEVVRLGFLWLGIPLSIGTAVYTAFLMGQAEGRDLWQSALLPFHLLVQSVMIGSLWLLLLQLFVAMPDPLIHACKWIAGVSLVIDAFMILGGEFGMPHASEVAASAAHEITQGKYKKQYWFGMLLIGHVLPFLFILPNVGVLSALATVLATIGLYVYEHIFIMAPQEVPNS